jgi:hypothetical protein
MTYPRSHQQALGITQPVSVLWATLRELLTIEEFAAVEAAYRAQSRRYQRACELNQLARWVWTVERRASNDPATLARLEKRRAILANPLAYVNGEDA